MSSHILLVLTSADTMGDFPRKTGYWVEEVAVPYFEFTRSGCLVSIASPNGGLPPRDAESEKPEYYSAECARFDADTAAREMLADTLPLAHADPQNYSAVFFAGGHGTMVDFPSHSAVIHSVEAFYTAGKPVASVCHGPACLVGARTPEGAPLIAGRKFTCFTDEEEAAAGGTAHVPFLLQSHLQGQGGIFNGGGLFSPCAVRDGLIITGQNPASAAKAAQLTLSAVK